MNNHTLARTATFISYYKELRQITGSVTGSILMQQLDYWFSKTHGKPFYKFKAPCEHALYKEGDSFTEELGFSVDEFTNAFSKIGTVFKSKTEFEVAEDKFSGKYYACYIDRQKSLTFYYRNNELLDKALHSIFTVNGESPFTGNGESQFAENGKVNLQKTGKSISPIYITEDYNRRIQQKSKTTAGGLVSNVSGVKQSLTAQKPKKEKACVEFEEFWLSWKAMCDKKGSAYGDKKPAKVEYDKVLKGVKQCDIMRVLNAFNGFIQQAFEANKHAVRWLKSVSWDDIDGVINEYKSQEVLARQKKASEKSTQGTSQKQPIKTAEEIEAERVQELASIEKKNLAYSKLVKEQQEHTDGFSDYLLKSFNHFHERWIFNCIFIVSGSEKTTLEIQIFDQRNTSVIEKNIDKILYSYRGFKFEVDNIILTQK